MNEEKINKLVFETANLAVSAHNEKKRVNNLSFINKCLYICKALQSYVYYEWYAFYFNNEARKEYLYAKEVYNIMNKIDNGVLCPSLQL